MKNITLYLSLLLFVSQAFSQDDTLMVINNKAISEGEFLRIYQKNNNTGNVVEKKSVEEYLDLFINFKLKVAEAESLGMDTLPKFKKELNGYKVQLEKPYFTDKSVDEKLVEEAYERQEYDVRASHILIMVKPNASPADSLVAYNKIKAIKKEIEAGKDFKTVAKQKSEDPSAKQNSGDLGYFTVFQMVYPFENAAFNTPKGEISDIVRTRYGYHILKVYDKRKAQGEVHVAHIMVGTPKDANEDALKKSEEKINMIYSKLEAGEKFKDLAQLYSDDKASAKKGGELQWFGTGRMVPIFERTAFSLEKNGDYSKPIKTNFGWHILQLLGKKDAKQFLMSKDEIRKKIRNDMRGAKSKTVVFERLKKDYKYKSNSKRLAEFYKLNGDSLFAGNWNKKLAKNLNKTLFSLNDSAYNQALFVDYIETNTKTRRKEVSVRAFIDKMYHLYINNELKVVERSYLPVKYPEYKYLLQEYHDGILLFDLTDEKVWSKAIEDSTGLANFYSKNKQNYLWGQRVEAQIYLTKDKKISDKLKKTLLKKEQKGYTTEYILASFNKKDSTNLELINANIYSKEDYTIVDEANKELKFFDEKNLETPMFFQKDNKLVFISKIIAPTNKELNEAKGQITADYQDYLEKVWIKELRKKYPVKMNDVVWNKIKTN